jgi:hypothetical protein
MSLLPAVTVLSSVIRNQSGGLDVIVAALCNWYITSVLGTWKVASAQGPPGSEQGGVQPPALTDLLTAFLSAFAFPRPDMLEDLCFGGWEAGVGG